MHLLARSWATWVKVLNFLLANDSTIRDLNASCESSSGHQLLSPTNIYPSRSGLTKVSSTSFISSSVCVIYFFNVSCSNSSFSLLILKRFVAFFFKASSSCYLDTVYCFTSVGSGTIEPLARPGNSGVASSSGISALSSPYGLLTTILLEINLLPLIVLPVFSLYFEFFFYACNILTKCVLSLK